MQYSVPPDPPTNTDMSESLRKHPDSADSLASSKASRHSEDKSHFSKLQIGATVKVQMASNSSLPGCKSSSYSLDQVRSQDSVPNPGKFETKGEKFLQLFSSMMLLRLKLSQTHCQIQLWLMKFCQMKLW